jgi:DNA-binding NarL/FixJ family response regulator
MKTLKIFIVDDDPLYISALKIYIECNCQSLVVISNYLTGEEMLKDLKKRPDFIFLDFYLNATHLHARNGMSILKKIEYRLPNTKVIVLSAQDNIEIALETLKNGATEYLVKNKSEFSKVNHIISEFIKKKEKRRSKIVLLLPFIILILLTALFLLNRLI